MPKRVIDFDALWASDKIAACPAWAQAEYAWLYGLADASGSFELTNLRVIWGRVAAVRKDLSIERLEQILQEFVARGLLFTWEASGKRYGHWTGSDVPGRLPPPSWRVRLERLAPPLPRAELAAYMSRYASRRAPEFGGDAPACVECAQQYQGGEDGRGQAVPGRPGPALAAASSAQSEGTNAAQLKLGLEAPQAQDWNMDWKKERKREETPARVPADHSLECENAQQDPAVSAEELLEIYERERGKLPGGVTLTPERRRQCAQRVKSGLGREEFRAAVHRAAATPFLAGEGARGWRANFDWFIANDTNVRKVIEGVYDAADTGVRLGGLRTGTEARYGRRAALPDIYVGAGPVAADYGVHVKPEALARIRARDAARRPP